jgi:hypothetical protein
VPKLHRMFHSQILDKHKELAKDKHSSLIDRSVSAIEKK